MQVVNVGLWLSIRQVWLIDKEETDSRPGQDIGGGDEVIGAYPGGEDVYARYYQQAPAQPAAYEIHTVWNGCHGDGSVPHG